MALRTVATDSHGWKNLLLAELNMFGWKWSDLQLSNKPKGIILFLQNYFHSLVSRWTLLNCIRFCYMLSNFMIQILWIHIHISYHRKTFFISCKKKSGGISLATTKESVLHLCLLEFERFSEIALEF